MNLLNLRAASKIHTNVSENRNQLKLFAVCSSIQRAAVWVLDHYYNDFPVYNPALVNLPKSILSKKMTGFKVYTLDGKCRRLFSCCRWRQKAQSYHKKTGFGFETESSES